MAGGFGPVVKGLDGLAVLAAQKVGPVLVGRVGKNVPGVIGMELLPKQGELLGRCGVADGDLVFHWFSSIKMIGGSGSVDPPYTAQLHKDHPFLIKSAGKREKYPPAVKS